MMGQLVASTGPQAIRNKAAGQLMKIANKDPESSSSARYFGSIAARATGQSRTDAINQLMNFHVDSQTFKDFVKNATRKPSAPTEAAIRTACEVSSGLAQAEAAMALLKYLKTKNRYAGMTKEQLQPRFDNETIKYLLDSKRDPKVTAEAEAILERFVADGDRLLKSARNQLFILKNLSVGSTAPEITGVDLDGKEFKLSDYRGKIVFIDFWGDW